MDVFSIWADGGQGKTIATGVKGRYEVTVTGAHDCSFLKICPSSPPAQLRE